MKKSGKLFFICFLKIKEKNRINQNKIDKKRKYNKNKNLDLKKQKIKEKNRKKKNKLEKKRF